MKKSEIMMLETSLRLKQLRKMRGYSSEAYAYKFGLARSTVSRAECSKNIHLSSLMNHLENLQISLQDFYGMELNEEYQKLLNQKYYEKSTSN